MFCSKCGAPLNGASFCASCGTPAVVVPSATATPTVSPTAPNPVYVTPQLPVGGSRTNGMAIASLVTSLVCFGFLGIIFGIVALNQIKSSAGTQTGQGMAIAGIVIGSITTLFFFSYLSVLA